MTYKHLTTRELLMTLFDHGTVVVIIVILIETLS